MGISKTRKSDCRECCRLTNHEVMFEHSELLNVDFYHEEDTWQVVRCLGCSTIGFRHQNDDYENVREGPSGEILHGIYVALYPSVIKNHRKLAGTHYLPSIIQKIYQQTLTALSEKALVLASVRLRATIEATCSHLKVSGNTLEKRIDQLYKGGYVSNGDKNRLHAIRFLGNDAAHEIKEPSNSDILISLQIVEHMLNSVFILPKRARSLEIVVETYSDFLPVLKKCIKDYASPEQISLTGLLGRQRRQVGQLLEEFEKKLNEDISTGIFAELKLGHLQNVAGKDVQLYEVLLEKASDFDL
jgi:hypothetical protein